MIKGIKKLLFGVYAIAMILLLTACNSQLDIQQHYPFTLSVMPIQKGITYKETVEIRMSIIRDGYFEDAVYSIRYFQPNGEGELKLADNTVLIPNDLYELKEDTFRLYYTSLSKEQQKIDIYIEDNFGQIEQVSFNLNNKKLETDN